jgi:hypothetical protein
MKHVSFRAVASIFFLLLTSHALWSQETTAAMTGRVTDPSGAPVAEVAVTAIDAERGSKFAALTNTDGIYNFARVPVGRYMLQVQHSGFESISKKDITLVLNQVARLDFKLQVGKVTQVAEVTGEAPILETSATQLGTVLDANTNAQLPLATRNYVQLTLLTAGAVTPNPAGFKTPQTTYSSDRPYINGNREQENNFILDGMDNNQASDNLVSYTPNVDAIEEFNIITQNAPAEFGNFMGGIVSVSTKAGTNTYHGDAFEFFRNDQLNANEWMNNLTGAKRPKLRWNEFGATFGGPVIHDKLFFFADYQGSRFDQPATTTAVSVLTTAERSGNFSQLLSAGAKATQLYNPFSTAASGQRAPFAGNMIPATLLSPAATALLNSSYYPQPVNGNLINNQFNTNHSATNADQGDMRVDWNVTENDRIFGRYSQAYTDNPATNSLPLSYNTFGHFPIHNGVLDYTKTLSPRLVNDLRLGVNYNVNNLGTAATTLPNLAQQFGIAGVPTNILPQLIFTGGYGSSIGATANVKLFADTLMQYEDTALFTLGNHAMSFGFQGERIRSDTFYSGGNGLAGSFTFDGQYTTSSPSIKFGAGQGEPEADFLLGLPSSIAGGSNGGSLGQRANILAGFFQDNWRVTPDFTLNLGLRYELHTPWEEVNNREENFAPFSGQIEVAGQSTYYNNNRALYNQYNGIYNFQPRIGLAWTPGGGHTVIRAAYGLSSYLEGTGINLRLIVNPPFFLQNNVNYASLAFPATTLSQGDAAISSPTNPYVGANLRVWDPNVRPAVSNQWNFTVQHQFGNSTTLQIGYVGQKNDHLMVAEPYFQKQLTSAGTVLPSPYLAGNPAIDSVIGNISGTESSGNQSYNSLQTTLQRRLAEGLQFQAAYTYSKCMTDSIGFYGEGGGQDANQAAYAQNLYNRAAEWGPCYFDAKHVFTGYLSYNLPFGRNRQFAKNMHPALDAVLGGWQVNGILSLHTGFPLTIAASDNSGTGSRGPRANCLAPAVVYGEQDAAAGGYQWLNAADFGVPAKGTFGSCGVGTVRGPGLHTVDLSLSKLFTITERQHLEFRAEFLNATNTTILNAPVSTVGATLGLIQSSQGARNIQFGLKYKF